MIKEMESFLKFFIDNPIQLIIVAVATFGFGSAIKILFNEGVKAHERKLIALSLALFSTGVVLSFAHSPILSSVSLVMLVVGWLIFGRYTHVRNYDEAVDFLNNYNRGLWNDNPALINQINFLTNDSLKRNDVHALAQRNVSKIIAKYFKRQFKNNKE